MLERVAEAYTIALVNTCDLLPHLTIEAIENEAFAVHYRQYHHGQAPQLSFKLLKSESNTVSRKIIGAMYINQLKPEINDKEKCISITDS